MVVTKGVLMPGTQAARYRQTSDISARKATARKQVIDVHCIAVPFVSDSIVRYESQMVDGVASVFHVDGTYSKAPISQAVPVGRFTPRWSVIGPFTRQAPVGILSIAVLPRNSLRVQVGPPLFRSSGSMPRLENCSPEISGG